MLDFTVNCEITNHMGKPRLDILVPVTEIVHRLVCTMPARVSIGLRKSYPKQSHFVY